MIASPARTVLKAGWLVAICLLPICLQVLVRTRILTCIRINCIQNAFARPTAVRSITTVSPTIPPNLTPLVFSNRH
jgi:hypothetical protein